jgi:hypothetical protein
MRHAPEAGLAAAEEGVEAAGAPAPPLAPPELTDGGPDDDTGGGNDCDPLAPPLGWLPLGVSVGAEVTSHPVVEAGSRESTMASISFSASMDTRRRASEMGRVEAEAAVGGAEDDTMSPEPEGARGQAWTGRRDGWRDGRGGGG